MTQVILVRNDGALILLEAAGRDDPHSRGLVSALGGPQVDGLSPHDTARVYLQDFTNLPHADDSLVYWRRYPEEQTHIFLLHQVDGSQLRELWGDRLVVIHNDAEARRLNLVPALRRAVSDYYLELRK